MNFSIQSCTRYLPNFLPRRRMSPDQQDSYIAAIKCMLEKTAEEYPVVPAASNRYEDFVAAHISSVWNAHYVVRAFDWGRVVHWNLVCTDLTSKPTREPFILGTDGSYFTLSKQSSRAGSREGCRTGTGRSIRPASKSSSALPSLILSGALAAMASTSRRTS